MSMNGRSPLDGLLGDYTAPIPDIAKKYESNIIKGGFLDMPGFNELFDLFRRVGEREAGRNAAAITESFGSQGGRYSSDLLGAQTQARGNFMDTLLNRAREYQLALRGQQANEVGALASMRYGANEAGMTRYFQDFLRRTSPPPGYSDLLNMSASYGLPPTVI